MEQDTVSVDELDVVEEFQVPIIAFEQYTALDVASQYSILFVPVLVLIIMYILMRILSMRRV